MCMFSVSTYHEGILFLKLNPIYQRNICNILVLMKGRNKKKGACGSSYVEKSVIGNFHRGSNIFPELSRERQCVSIALINIFSKVSQFKGTSGLDIRRYKFHFEK